MASIKHLVDLDLNKNQLLNAVVQNLAVAPTSPNQGQIYWDTAQDSLFVWDEDGSAWIDLGSDGITNLAYTAGVSNGVVTSDSGDNATIPLADGTNAGLFSAAEKSKLSAIEAGAQADQNASEVVSSASGNLTSTNVQAALQELQGDIDSLGAETNDLGITHNASDIDVTIENGSDITIEAATTTEAGAMTAADKTKLDGIEANAKDDQSASQVPSSASGNLTSTNVQSALEELQGDIDSLGSETNNLSITHNAGDVDIAIENGTDITLDAATSLKAGAMVASDKVKLDAIEAGATADQVASEVASNASGNLVATNVQAALEELQGSIDTTDGNVSTNASDISQNTSDIAQNASDIAALDTNVSTNITIDQTGASQVIVESSDGTDGTITAATTSVAGVMTSADKTKLDGIAAGAQVNVDDVVTSLALASNILTYTDEEGTDTDIDLSLYLDDSNLARLTSGSIDGSTGIATFTRDDASTFTIDMSAFLDAITLNNTLTSTSTTEGLTAAQGKVLKDLIDTINTNNTGTNTGDEVAATTTTQGIIELATQAEVNAGTDTTRAITPSRLRSTLGITASLTTTLTFSGTIGNGTLTSIPVTHSIGNQFVQASVYDVSTTDKVECEIELTSASVTTFKFNVAPTTNQYRVVITG